MVDLYIFHAQNDNSILFHAEQKNQEYITSKPKLTQEFAESANSVWTAIDNLLTNQIPGSVLDSTCEEKI